MRRKIKRKQCFVCRQKSKWFYENVHFLRTKHSQRTIPAVTKTILGDAFDSLCLNPAAMCFNCANRMNEYDEAYGKVRAMERELKSSICVDLTPITEDAGNTVIATDADVNANADAIESNLENMELDAEDRVDVLIANDVGNGESLEQPENVQTDENMEHKPVDDSVNSVKNRPEKKKTGAYCRPCKKHFKNQQGLMLHTYHFHINTKRFECSNCHKLFVRQDLHERHMASCSSVPLKIFKCFLCPKKFGTQLSLKKHRSLHGPLTEMEGPYICDYCGIKLSEHKKYLDHRVLHTTRPKFQCLECDRILASRSTLKVHMSIHTTETPHLCDICGKSYGRAGGLLDHIRRHYNEFRTECYLCKHKEKTTSDLRNHMRKHTGEKPFPCTECGKRFSDKTNRDTHYRLHFGPLEKPHKCTICTDAFARPGLLTKHYLKAHGVHKEPATTAKLIKITR